MTAVLARRLVLSSVTFVLAVLGLTLLLWPLGDTWVASVARMVAGWPGWALVMRVWDWSKVE